MTVLSAKISHEDSLVHFAILNCGGGGDGVVYLLLWVGGEESPCCEQFVICVGQHKPVM
jgi:hypothetical protein